VKSVFLSTVFCAVVAHAAAWPVSVGESMPIAAQNALVQKYCATCHTDAKRAGGLSLEHFDAKSVAPSVAAMMLSKVRSGAMGAAAIPMPDQSTVDAFAGVLSLEAKGAATWTIESKGTTITASVLREVAAPSKPGGQSLYRLVMTCDAATTKGEMQLAWSPLPARATLAVTLGNKSFTYDVDGADFRGLPSQWADSVVVTGLFPGERVAFSFDDLPIPARRGLAPCFRD
jgi:hypothetical protein